MNPREVLRLTAAKAKRMHELYPFTATRSSAALAVQSETERDSSTVFPSVDAPLATVTDTDTGEVVWSGPAVKDGSGRWAVPIPDRSGNFRFGIKGVTT